MRLAILADIHANLPALEAVLADIDKRNVDGIIVAGDHLTGGPCPVETFRLIESLDVWGDAWAIRGNTDNRILAYDAGDVPDAWRTSDQWAGLRWLHARLDGDACAWLASLPEQCVVAMPDAPPYRIPTHIRYCHSQGKGFLPACCSAVSFKVSKSAAISGRPAARSLFTPSIARQYPSRSSTLPSSTAAG